MVNGGIAKRYARALVSLTKGEDQQSLKDCLQAFENIERLFEITKAKKILCSPIMPTDLKLKLLHYALNLEGKGSPLLERFLVEVVDAGRTEIFPEIINAFRRIIDAKNKVVRATITSAVDLSQQELDGLRSVIAGSEYKVVVTEKMDPSILGGVIVGIGHNIVDLSVKTRLERLAKRASGLA